MAYTKTNWQTGDTITAVKLNNMEDGIGNSMPLTPNTLVVNFTLDTQNYIYISDTSFSDMGTALDNGNAILAVVPRFGSVPLTAKFDSEYNIELFYNTNVFTDGSGPSANTATVIFNTFSVTYDSTNDRTVGNITGVSMNCQLAT